MNNLKEIEIEGNRIFLKGKNNNYRIVHPIKIDGKIVWKNLICGGSWWNLLKIGLLVGFILFVIWSYSNDIQAVRSENCLNITKSLYNFSI